MRIRKTYNGVVPNGKILNTRDTSQNDTYSCDYINELSGKVLWTNPNPSDTFAGQTITLNDDLSNYTYIEIISRQSTSSGNMLSSGKIPIDMIAVTTYLPIHYNMLRTFNTSTKTFRDNLYFSTFGNINSTTSDNNYNIPYQIIGYK